MSEHQADKDDLKATGATGETPSIVPDISDPAPSAAGQADATPAVAASGGSDAAAKAEQRHFPISIVPMRETGGDAHGRHGAEHNNEAAASMSRTRKFGAVAAIVAVAAVLGAFGGSLATAGLGHVFATPDTAKAAMVAENHALKDSVARLDADVTALKASFDRTGKARTAQYSKVGERLDKVEKAQDDTSNKLTKLSEAQDKLRTASVTPAPKEVKETTASVPAPAPKPEAAKLPVLEGWILRDIADGGATVEGRTGIYEVFPGDPLPGLNRVQAVRKMDGRWVVVTAKGLIVAR